MLLNATMATQTETMPSKIECTSLQRQNELTIADLFTISEAFWHDARHRGFIERVAHLEYSPISKDVEQFLPLMEKYRPLNPEQVLGISKKIEECIRIEGESERLKGKLQELISSQEGNGVQKDDEHSTPVEVEDSNEDQTSPPTEMVIDVAYKAFTGLALWEQMEMLETMSLNKSQVLRDLRDISESHIVEPGMTLDQAKSCLKKLYNLYQHLNTARKNSYEIRVVDYYPELLDEAQEDKKSQNVANGAN